MVDIANFRFDDSNGSFEGGYKKQAQIMDDQARARAGNALTAGNYRGAADELYGNGDLQLGSQVQGAGEARALAAQKQKDDKRLALLKFTGETFQNLAAVHQQNNGDPTKTVAAFDLLAPQFAQFGEPPEEIARVRSALAADTVGTLTALRDGVAKEMEPFTLNPGDQRFVGNKVVASVAPKQEYQAVPEGGMLVPVPQAGQPAPVQPAPQQAQVPAPAAAPTGQPRSVRNANPGNIEDGPWARSLPGYKGSDGRFAIFEDDNAGANAQAALLTSYGKRGLNTVSSIINRWAPPSENDTNAYVDFVAKKVGVGPNQQLDMTDPATISDVAMAIRQFEGGGQSRSNGQAAAQMAPGVGPPGTIYGRPKPDKGAVQPPAAAGLTELGGGFYQDALGRIYQPDANGKLSQTVGIGDAEVKKSVGNITGLNNVMSAVDRYRQTVSRLGPGDFGPLGKYAGDPAKYAEAKAAATDLMMTLKGPEVYNLGVITGPDLSILEGVVADPAKFDTMIRKGQIPGAIGQLEKSVRSKYDSERESFKTLGGKPDALPKMYAPQGAPKERPPQGARKGASGKYYAPDPAKPESFPEVRQREDGQWFLKSSDGSWYRVK